MAATPAAATTNKGKTIDQKERKKIPRQQMPEQDPRRRRHNFEEVPYGYTEELAMLEARRCLKCKKPGCVQGCPVNIDIPAFISLIEQGKFLEAARKLKEQNTLPAVTGRVCPQEVQCESRCILGRKENRSIGRLERFCGLRDQPVLSRPHRQLRSPASGWRGGLRPARTPRQAIHQARPSSHTFSAFRARGADGGTRSSGAKGIVQFEINYLRLGAEIITDRGGQGQDRG
jgi:glutamate synthase (NADPH/NADH) small chain